MSKYFTCHPIQSLKIGKFEFERGSLALEEAEAKELRKLLASSPIVIRSRVREIDVEKAQEIAASNVEKPAATKGSNSLTASLKAPSTPTAPVVGGGANSEGLKNAEGAGE